MKSFALLIILGLALAQIRNMPLPEITAGSEEGWHDFQFVVLHQSTLSDRSTAIDVAGAHDGKTLAFCIILFPEWEEGGQSFHVYSGHAALRSAGKSSDFLIEAIDSLYGTKLGLRTFKKTVPFDAVSLEGNPSDVRDEPIKLKLFYDPANQANYAEVYLNIDLKKEIVELHEKDEEYRNNIVLALGEQLPSSRPSIKQL